MTAIIVALNAELVYEQVRDWIEAAGDGWLVGGRRLVPWFRSALAVLLLVWMVFRRETAGSEAPEGFGRRGRRPGRRLAAAFPAHRRGAGRPARATPPCWPRPSPWPRIHQAELVLMHVVDGVGGTWYGDQTGDLESRDDEAYLQTLAERLRVRTCEAKACRSIEAVLGYGDASDRIRRISPGRKAST